jgi:transposase-like protein
MPRPKRCRTETPRFRGVLPCCPRCKHPGYREDIHPDTGRPRFICDRCGETWSAGIGGGEWAGRGLKEYRR